MKKQQQQQDQSKKKKSNNPPAKEKAQSNENTQKEVHKESRKQEETQQIPPRIMKFRVEHQNEDPNQQMPGAYQNQLTRRFKINLRVVSQSFKNKLSMRFQEVDRQFVCRKTKEQRAEMGIEFENIKLIDIYTKSNQNKVVQKYGKQLIINLVFNHDNEPTMKRKVELNPEYKPPQISPEEEQEEEKLLDEQKLFQNLHQSLVELQKKYGKSIEQVSELFLRVCGDMDAVEAALEGRPVTEWTYLEDLALTKPFESTEFQWLLKLKGQKEIDKRRKFLLTADNEQPEEKNSGDQNMRDETGAGAPEAQGEADDNNPHDETVGYI